jgi:hypothetical protein
MIEVHGIMAATRAYFKKVVDLAKKLKMKSLLNIKKT